MLEEMKLFGQVLEEDGLRGWQLEYILRSRRRRQNFCRILDSCVTYRRREASYYGRMIESQRHRDSQKAVVGTQ
jgi:hypothetical protein